MRGRWLVDTQAIVAHGQLNLARRDERKAHPAAALVYLIALPIRFSSILKKIPLVAITSAPRATPEVVTEIPDVARVLRRCRRTRGQSRRAEFV